MKALGKKANFERKLFADGLDKGNIFEKQKTAGITISNLKEKQDEKKPEKFYLIKTNKGIEVMEKVQEKDVLKEKKEVLKEKILFNQKYQRELKRQNNRMKEQKVKELIQKKHEEYEANRIQIKNDKLIKDLKHVKANEHRQN